MINSGLAAYKPEKCAQTVLKAAKMKNPPARMTPGFLYKLAYALSKFASWRLKQFALSRIYLSKDPAKDADWTYDKHFKER